MMNIDISILVLRLAFGLIFIVHGWPKIRNVRMTGQHFETMGFKPGHLWGTLVAAVEFLGGLAVFFGVYTQPAALAIACVMLVALFWKIGKGQSLIGGYELDLILLSVAISLALMNAGGISIDAGLMGGY